MSYSRWSHSRWYAFWIFTDFNEDEDRDHQVLCIMRVADYFAFQLRADLEGCLTHAIGREEAESKKSVTIEEQQELRDIMRRFLQDVDEQCPV